MAEELPPPCVQIGEYVLQFEKEEMGAEFEERARKELRETPEVGNDAIAALKDLLRDDKELLFPLDDENMLRPFLRPCKYYPESAYEKMKLFYKFRLKNPKFYDELLPNTIKNTILQDVLTIFPLRSQFGRRIFLVHVGKWDVKKLSLTDIVRCVFLFVDIAITEHRTQISGVDVIFDLEGLSIQHIYQIGPSFASNILHWAQDCVPLRIKGLHIVNQPYIFNMLFAIFKPFLSVKFRKRIYFHGRNYESLLRHIGAKYLPKEYGGTMDLPQVNRMEFYQLLCMYKNDFEEGNKYGYEKTTK
ncbi:Alpha-tocopherol transfer protein-like [Zootermopsis nevadensis]|uniref:Alpha-tocopherol transfer protein-like n=2 Tax=Zootermopsis nevadensis TaxID=136037 RepID=A0A067RE65_ZOONE|nr:Alpha-tocopherol transfer protein-like [Zootermopsis nevadensis]